MLLGGDCLEVFSYLSCMGLYLDVNIMVSTGLLSIALFEEAVLYIGRVVIGVREMEKSWQRYWWRVF